MDCPRRVAVVLVARALLDSCTKHVVDAAMVPFPQIVGWRTNTSPFQHDSCTRAIIIREFMQTNKNLKLTRRVDHGFEHAIAWTFLDGHQCRVERVGRANIWIGVAVRVLAMVDVVLAHVAYHSLRCLKRYGLNMVNVHLFGLTFVDRVDAHGYDEKALNPLRPPIHFACRGSTMRCIGCGHSRRSVFVIGLLWKMEPHSKRLAPSQVRSSQYCPIIVAVTSSFRVRSE